MSAYATRIRTYSQNRNSTVVANTDLLKEEQEQPLAFNSTLSGP